MFDGDVLSLRRESIRGIMRLMFEQKKPGRIRQSVEPIAYEIEGNPTTVGELISATVKACVEVFNNKALKAPDREDMDADDAHKPLSDGQIADMAETGRVAFGIVYNGKTADPSKAVENALQAYEDGLFMLFLNGIPLGGADEKIHLNEGDVLTAVRLTLLAGRLW